MWKWDKKNKRWKLDSILGTDNPISDLVIRRWTHILDRDQISTERINGRAVTTWDIMGGVNLGVYHPPHALPNHYIERIVDHVCKREYCWTMLVEGGIDLLDGTLEGICKILNKKE